MKNYHSWPRVVHFLGLQFHFQSVSCFPGIPQFVEKGYCIHWFVVFLHWQIVHFQIVSCFPWIPQFVGKGYCIHWFVVFLHWQIVHFQIVVGFHLGIYQTVEKNYLGIEFLLRLIVQFQTVVGL
uniref:Uncharacterized protein n=1 Tax=Lepeophtheirus salmonis TaxID=72036 RepID=A0A0K2UDZ1_LEPSM